MVLVEPALLDRARRLSDARTAYQKALQLDPRLHEARLRLARVLDESGHPDQALKLLDSVLDSDCDQWVRYLARLFSGAACETLGRAETAISHYEAAAGIMPHAQSARIALSHALLGVGERDGSLRVVLQAADKAAHSGTDPWGGYMYGQARLVAAGLAAMWGEIAAR